MKKTLTILAVAVTVTLGAANCWAQNLAKVGGTATGVDGKPIVGATVELMNTDNGQKYEFKTDSKGEYFSVGINPGSYKISLIQDGKVLFFFNHVPVHLNEDDSPNKIDFNLPKELAAQQAAGGGAKMTPEQQQQAVAAQKKNANIGAVNAQLQQLPALEQAGNWDQAIALMTQATQTLPDQDLVWAKLGEAQLGAGGAAKGDKAVATQHYQAAAQAYQKAVQLKPTNGKYHNNLGQAYAKSGKPQEALAEYTAAAQADPTDAALYYFNLGAILTNQATSESNAATKAKDIEEANTAFDKAIAAKPDYAEAWYQKGINLLSKATIDKEGKMVPAPGTAEAFNKYLELQPTGPRAAEAKGLIESLGASVQTSYKKKPSK